MTQTEAAAIRLFAGPTSPYVRKVRALILEAGIAGVELMPASGTPLDPGTVPVDLNPLGKVPALVTPTGQVLYDSRVICRWLDAYASAGFYPQGEALWRVLTLEALADGILDAALLMVYEARLRPEELRFAPWVEGQWIKIDRSLDAVEASWLGDLAGPVTMAQIGLASALGYLDFRHSARDWRRDRPGLAAWEAEFARRPSMRETLPDG